MKKVLVLAALFLAGCGADSEPLEDPYFYYDLEAKVISVYDCKEDVCLARVKLDEKGLVVEQWKFLGQVKVGDKAFKKCWFKKYQKPEDRSESYIHNQKSNVDKALGNNNCKEISYIQN